MEDNIELWLGVFQEHVLVSSIIEDTEQSYMFLLEHKEALWIFHRVIYGGKQEQTYVLSI